MNASQPRKILAAAIIQFDETRKIPPSILTDSFTSVFLKAWGVSNIETTKPFEGILFVEGRKLLLEISGLVIFSMPIEVIDEAVEAFLKAPKEGNDEGIDDENLMILSLGSPVFCQDIIRFVGIDREGLVTDTSLEVFTSRIADAKPGEVIWTDSETESVLHEGDIITMLLEAKRMGAISG